MKKWNTEKFEWLNSLDIKYLNNPFSEEEIDYINNPLKYEKKSQNRCDDIWSLLDQWN